VPEIPKPDFLPILRILGKHAVNFIVVGGVAAVVQGAPIMTLDLEVLYSTEPGNLSRLLVAIDDLDGYYRMPPEKRLRPRLSHLTAGGHNLLATRFGPLDVLGRIGNNRSYEDLLPHTKMMDLGEELTARVLDLATLIAVKEEAAREKDRATLPILRRTLDETRRT
jgi:hypothetical protein